jgi:type II secretory pathway pseudopilin PulG
MNFKKKQKGFTLVEVLVSVSLFIMVIIALSQVYISVIRSERIAYVLLNSENNIRNSLEIMARSIRIGKNFDISPNHKELCFDYYLEGVWERYCYRFNETHGTLEKLSEDGSFVSILDPQLKVNHLQFYIKGGDFDSQASIIVAMEVSTQVKEQEYLFNLQTAVTPRSLGVEILEG